MALISNNGNKRQSRTKIIAVLIFTGLIVGLVMLSVLNPSFLSGSPYMAVRVPLVTTTLTSSISGQDENVQTLFTVQMDKSARSKVGEADLYEALSEIMTDMDLAHIQASDGVEYITQRVTKELNARLPDYADTKVFMTGLYVGDRLLLEDTRNSREDRMRGLFPNLK